MKMDRRTLIRAAVSAGTVATLPLDRLRAKEAAHDGPWTISEFVSRPDGLKSDDWIRHWLENRKPLIRAVPGVAAARLNVLDPERSPEAPYHGVVQYGFASHAAMLRATGGARDPALDDALTADNRIFQKRDPMTIVSRTISILDAPTSGVSRMAKRIGLVGGRPDMPRQRFQQEWEHVHAPDVLGQYGLEGYLLEMAAQPMGLSAPWDGYAELWWTDWEALAEAQRRGSNNYRERAGFFHDHLLLYVTQID